MLLCVPKRVVMHAVCVGATTRALYGVRLQVWAGAWMQVQERGVWPCEHLGAQQAIVLLSPGRACR